MNKFAKTIAFILAAATTAFSLTACNNSNNSSKSTKSILYVNTRDAGIGSDFLEEFKQAFEKKYAETSFETGKMGVDVQTDANRNNEGAALISNIANSMYSVSIVEAMNYADFMPSQLLLDISKTVKEDLDDGSGSIYSKMDDMTKAYLEAYDGKIYATPWLSGFEGLTYNAELFKSKKFYFADENGLTPFAKSSYTGAAYTGRGFIKADTDKKSCGPDGVYGTYDDGLPSSYEEFFYLMDYMVEKGVTPMIRRGGDTHYINYLFQSLLVNYSGAEETSYNFSFDSNGKTANIVTGFNGEEAIVEKTVITKDNGYLMRQQEGRYYASKFLTKLFKDESKYFHSTCATSALTNLDAQTLFYETGLNQNYDIAMLIEGNYWYNEAKTARESAVSRYGENAKNRDLRYMSLPSIEVGTINEGEGKPVALADGLYHFIVVNNNIKDNPVKVKLATEFLKFCYEDSTLQTFTMSTGLPVSVTYDLTDEQYNSMDKYYQSLWDSYSASVNGKNYLSPLGGSKIFISNWVTFGFSTASQFYTSTVNGKSYETAKSTIKDGISLKDFFNGMSISKSSWDSLYNIYG